MLQPAPWWARFIISLVLLALASRMLVGDDQLAIAGGIVGYVAAHWLPAVGGRLAPDKEA
jgi:hypothetical protein